MSRTDTLAMLFPNVATTKGISVRVSVSYLAEQSAPASGRWFWSYHVRIENGSKRPVPLLSRSWHILDGRGTLHGFRGEGVCGGNAADRARRRLRYVSGCPLNTPDRVDEWELPYDDENGAAFDVAPHRDSHLSGRQRESACAISPG